MLKSVTHDSTLQYPTVLCPDPEGITTIRIQLSPSRHLVAVAAAEKTSFWKTRKFLDFTSRPTDLSFLVYSFSSTFRPSTRYSEVSRTWKARTGMLGQRAQLARGLNYSGSAVPFMALSDRPFATIERHGTRKQVKILVCSCWCSKGPAYCDCARELDLLRRISIRGRRMVVKSHACRFISSRRKVVRAKIRKLGSAELRGVDANNK